MTSCSPDQATAAGGPRRVAAPTAHLTTADRPPADLHAAVALALVRGVGSVGWGELTRRHGGAAAALQEAVPDAERTRACAGASRLLDQVGAFGGEVLVRGTPGYPPALLELPDPPPLLFALGALGLLERPIVAIVGTRRSSRYGERMAGVLADAVATAGGVVASGMARGIDAAAHRAALAATGETIAVLGTGVDVAYPAAHTALRREIAGRGLLLSELPPGARADAGSFPRRNRLIAALARVSLVVEAGHRSGALITAGHALELGRTVAAVPGPIDLPDSAGSNELLRDGAQVIASPDDLLQLAGLARHQRREAAPELSPSETRVWSCLARGAVDLDTLVAATALPVPECLAAVGRLEAAGLVACALTGEIRRRAHGR